MTGTPSPPPVSLEGLMGVLLLLVAEAETDGSPLVSVPTAALRPVLDRLAAREAGAGRLRSLAVDAYSIPSADVINQLERSTTL